MIIPDGAFARVANSYRENPDVDLWHGRCRIVDQFGAKVDERIGSIERYDDSRPLGRLVEGGTSFSRKCSGRSGSAKIGAFREDLIW